MPDQKLIDYATRFLSTRRNAPIPVHAAAFAEQLRDGCKQDLLRVIEQVSADTPKDCDGQTALRILGSAIAENIDSWGMPDCDCKKSDCVYCSTGMATTPAKPIAG